MSDSSSPLESRSHLLKLRRFLRSEAASLLKELNAQDKTLSTRLQKVQKRLERDSDSTLLSELATVRRELASVRRGLARLAMSGQETQKLKNEWHDWQRHAEVSQETDHELRAERLEMVASELRSRGIEMEERAWSEMSEPVSIPIRSIEESNADIFELPPPTMLEVAEESEPDQAWSEAGSYWERLVAGLGPSHGDIRQLARILKAFRSIQGECKREDRRKGIRRYRLVAFEGWG